MPRSRSGSRPGGCYMLSRPPALFAFPLPLLMHTSWRNRWFKSGRRNQSVFSFNHFPNPATVRLCDFRCYRISRIRLLLRVPLADNFRPSGLGYVKSCSAMDFCRSEWCVSRYHVCVLRMRLLGVLNACQDRSRQGGSYVLLRIECKAL